MSAPANPTRQQLEELDALLQRMLSLPLNQQEAMPAPPLSPAPPSIAPPPLMPPRPAMASPPRRRVEPPSGDNAWNIPLPPTGTPPVVNGWPSGIESLNLTATSVIAPKPASAPSRLRVASVASAPEATPMHEPPAATPRLRIEAPPPMTIPIPPPRPLPARPLEAPLPFYLWPLGLVDRTMGELMAAFGPPGRWLGQGSGKIFFGWCGLALMTAAAVWGVMDYMGWSW